MLRIIRGQSLRRVVRNPRANRDRFYGLLIGKNLAVGIIIGDGRRAKQARRAKRKTPAE